MTWNLSMHKNILHPAAKSRYIVRIGNIGGKNRGEWGRGLVTPSPRLPLLPPLAQALYLRMQPVTRTYNFNLKLLCPTFRCLFHND